jgi:UTP--glucose-1-phosphate uridylyltransferase
MGGRGAHDLVPELMRVHLAENVHCVASVERVSESDFHRRAIIAPAEEPRPNAPAQITDLLEKPDPGEAPSDWALAGRYTFSPVVFDALEKVASTARGEILLADALRVMIGEGRRILGVPLGPDQVRYDAGHLEGYREANQALSEDVP